MGCIFSYCKKDNDELNQKFLIYTHCFICGKTFTTDDYNNHIVQCNKRNNDNYFKE